MKKVNPKAVLKNLPEEQQKNLYDYLETHSYPQGMSWLAEQGIAASYKVVRRFWHWYPLNDKLQTAATMAETVKEILRELPTLKLDEQQLSSAGLAIFEAQALEKKDSELYVSLRKLRQKDKGLQLQEERGRTATAQKGQQLAQKEEELKLAQRRFERETCRLYLEWFENAEARRIATSPISYADKIEALGRAMFGATWDEA